MRKHGQEAVSGPLTSEELKAAEMYWIKQGQKSLHRRYEQGEFKSLSPFKDNGGIIRVGGRVDEALVSYEQKHPVLLPNEHRISLLIVTHMHKYGHPGVATTTAKTRRKYWILKAVLDFKGKQTQQSRKVQVCVLP